MQSSALWLSCVGSWGVWADALAEQVELLLGDCSGGGGGWRVGGWLETMSFPTSLCQGGHWGRAQGTGGLSLRRGLVELGGREGGREEGRGKPPLVLFCLPSGQEVDRYQVLKQPY